MGLIGEVLQKSPRPNQPSERLVGEGFRLRGYRATEIGGGGADGGVDLVLTKGSDKFLVQCKQWRAFKVGVDVVRELYGVMAARGAAGGFVVTYALADAGAEITLASPAGGPAPVNPGSLKPEGQNDPVVERLLADAALQARVAATAKASDVDGAEFDAVFLPGGHGTMWDLPGDAGVTRAVERAFGADKLIASVCHGAAGL